MTDPPPFICPICTDRAGAEAVLAHYLTEQARPQLAVISITIILERYLANRREVGIPGADRLGWAHKPLVRILGMKPAEAITEAECRRYATRRHADGVTDATIRTELQALRAALRWAARRDVRLKCAWNSHVLKHSNLLSDYTEHELYMAGYHNEKMDH